MRPPARHTTNCEICDDQNQECHDDAGGEAEAEPFERDDKEGNDQKSGGANTTVIVGGLMLPREADQECEQQKTG